MIYEKLNYNAKDNTLGLKYKLGRLFLKTFLNYNKWVSNKSKCYKHFGKFFFKQLNNKNWVLNIN